MNSTPIPNQAPPNTKGWWFLGCGCLSLVGGGLFLVIVGFVGLVMVGLEVMESGTLRTIPVNYTISDEYVDDSSEEPPKKTTLLLNTKTGTRLYHRRTRFEEPFVEEFVAQPNETGLLTILHDVKTLDTTLNFSQYDQVTILGQSFDERFYSNIPYLNIRLEGEGKTRHAVFSAIEYAPSTEMSALIAFPEKPLNANNKEALQDNFVTLKNELRTFIKDTGIDETW